MNVLIIALAVLGLAVVAFIVFSAMAHKKRLDELSPMLVNLNYESRQRLRSVKFNGRHWPLEIAVSLLSALIQIYPMIGVLGTIIAIGKAEQANMSEAIQFSTAGIALAIVFLLIESVLAPLVQKVLTDGREMQNTLTSISSEK